METQTAERFLPGPAVKARYGKTHVTIWRWANDPQLRFPKPMKVNGLNYWRLSDLEAWEAGRREKA